MGSSNYEARNPAPVPADGSNTKIETQALIQTFTHMEAQQPSVSRVDQNPTMGFRNIQCQLNQLLACKFMRCGVHKVRDPGQEHVIGNAGVGCDI